MRRWTILLAALGGCAAEQVTLQPAEGGRGGSYYYELEQEGYNWGDVKVWSPGVHEIEDEPIMVEIRFRIRNDSDQTLEFEVKESYAEAGIEGRFERLQPDKPRQDVVQVEPGKTETVSLLFALPPSAAAKDVDEFEVNWSVRTPKGRSTQSSVFLLVRDADYAYYRPAYAVGYGYGYPYGYYRHRYWYDPWYW